MKGSIHQLNPAVSKVWLHLAAGLMWLGVGIMLIVIAATRWLNSFNWQVLMLVVLAGLILGSGIYWFGFSRLARKNIRRIDSYLKQQICIFAFQEWKSYPLVAFMVSLGIYLRSYSHLPIPLLATMYIGIGSGLFTSSLHYYQKVLNMVRPASGEVK
jgi:hypothetical protein